MAQPFEPSDRERAATDLAHASQAAAMFALTASIAHEISQPLSGLITNTNTCVRMLAADPADITGALGTLRRALRDISRASELITRLRAMFGEQELTLIPFDFNEAVREVIVLSAVDLTRSAIAVGSTLADDLPQIIGDRRQLQLVIVNLIRYACDATLRTPEPGRELLIRTEREAGGRVRVTIRDTNLQLPAVSAEALSYAACTMESDRMGIGLFVSRSIIERHRGRLWAERNEGVPGATLSFSIPTAGSA
ncbi:MAG TPA: sensor histidine kinase [Steroidobacteraceae bacterium]|nr:sensor histidine kinase [Steroidobacteraceae bacterium]